MSTCQLEDCDGRRYAGGLCVKHYRRWRTHGDVTVVATASGPTTRTPEQMLADLRGRLEEVDGCLVYRGARDRYGYGSVTWAGRRWKAHRLLWTLTVGPVDAGVAVCHRCDVPACCRVEHLWLGRQEDNLGDMAAKGRARNQHTAGRR